MIPHVYIIGNSHDENNLMPSYTGTVSGLGYEGWQTIWKSPFVAFMVDFYFKRKFFVCVCFMVICKYLYIGLADCGFCLSIHKIFTNNGCCHGNLVLKERIIVVNTLPSKFKLMHVLLILIY